MKRFKYFTILILSEVLNWTSVISKASSGS